MEDDSTPELRISCRHCGGNILIPPSFVETSFSCPHCGELISRPHPSPPPLPRQHYSSEAEHPHQNDGSLHERAKQGFYGLVETFKTLDYGYLFPLNAIFQPSFLRQRAVNWVITFGLLPLLILYIVLFFGLRFHQSAWLVGGYFCYFWAVYFNHLIQPDQSLWKRGIWYLFFTVTLGIPLLLFCQRLPIISTIYSGVQSQNLLGLIIGFVGGVGVFEETCKALPLLLFSLRRGPFPIREGVFLGLMSGLGFALAEVVQYSVNYWQETAELSAAVVAQAADESRSWLGVLKTERLIARLEEIIPLLSEHYGTILTVQIVRFIPLPLLHAAWAGTVGWFIATASTRQSSRWPTIVVGIGFVALLHGIYDIFSNGLIGLALAAFSVLIFLSYFMQGQGQRAASSPGDH